MKLLEVLLGYMMILYKKNELEKKNFSHTLNRAGIYSLQFNLDVLLTHIKTKKSLFP